MSDNKKYYYLKLKDSFFDSEEMKVIESMPNGAVYQNVYLKMCLLSIKSEGALTFKDIMPYDIPMLATVLRQNIDTVKTAVELFIKLGLVSITDTETMYMTDIQTLIGKSSTEADRVKAYRNKIKDTKTEQIECTESVQMYENCTPEIEIEIEKELDIELKKDKECISVPSEPFPEDPEKVSEEVAEEPSSPKKNNYMQFKKNNTFLANYFSKITSENKEIAESIVNTIENKIKTVSPKFHFTPNAKGNEEYEILEYARKNGVELESILNVLNLALKDNWWGNKINSTKFLLNNYMQLALKFKASSEPKSVTPMNYSNQDYNDGDIF